MSDLKFKDFLKDGNVHECAPRWFKKRIDIRESFPSPYRQDPDPLAATIQDAITKVDSLKGAEGGSSLLGGGPVNPQGPNYGNDRKAALSPNMRALDETINQSVELFKGLPNWNHPLTMPNVIPPANIASMTAAILTEIFSPNIIEGEYSWNVASAELQSAAMIARLLGWDPEVAGGLYTFGGSGCYFYGLKYALTRVLGKESRLTGIRTDGKVLVSQQGHYCKLNSSDWTGLGINNVIDIETDPETNCMDIEYLEEVMEKLYKEGTPIISIICTMGSTDAFALDPVKKVRELIEKYPNPPGFGQPFLYCDAVIGWSWLSFQTYDFENNPMDFRPEVLTTIKANLEAMVQMKYADAVGCDFHKVGWAPYNCSLFMTKDIGEFQRLMSRPGSDYLQERTSYNPGNYTLEVSRSGAYAMAGWATLKHFGHEGFQAVLGGILEVQHELRSRIECESDMVCVNSDDNGFVTLFRVYPSNVNASVQYSKELNWPDSKNELMKHNRLQEKVADKLWNWYKEGKIIDGCQITYTSLSTGFRPTMYNRDESDPNAMIYALKSFPMNVFIDAESMETLIKVVNAARDEVIAEGWL
ncbi:MAG: pyridoxal phosphate-dependent decarboxylase family protein [Candidatus Omnitrophota bacterium]